MRFWSMEKAGAGFRIPRRGDFENESHFQFARAVLACPAPCLPVPPGTLHAQEKQQRDANPGIWHAIPVRIDPERCGHAVFKAGTRISDSVFGGTYLRDAAVCRGAIGAPGGN